MERYAQSVQHRTGQLVVPGRVTLEAVYEDGEDWRTRSACGMGTAETFHPQYAGAVKAAKLVCRGCDVRTKCLDYALENDIYEGVWGGMSERERRKLKKRRT